MIRATDPEILQTILIHIGNSHSGSFPGKPVRQEWFIVKVLKWRFCLRKIYSKTLGNIAENCGHGSWNLPCIIRNCKSAFHFRNCIFIFQSKELIGFNIGKFLRFAILPDYLKDIDYTVPSKAKMFNRILRGLKSPDSIVFKELFFA